MNKRQKKKIQKKYIPVMAELDRFNEAIKDTH